MIHRRNFIGLGAVGLASLRNWSWAAPRRKAAAKNVLVIFEQGGMSHIDTWDPKPDAPVEHRSPFKPISSNVPGIQVTELLKKTARHMDKLSVIRCMTQPVPGVANSHPMGAQYIYSGETPGGAVEMPDMSSVIAMLMGSDADHLPSNIMVPGTNEASFMTRVGFIPPSHKVFKTGGNLADPKWSVPNLGLEGIDERRFKNRRDLLSSLDVGLTGAAKSKDAGAMRSFMEQAADMLTNPNTRKAFNLETEPAKTRERYGMGHRGQSYLMGRKLIQSGVRFVTVDCREPINTWRDGKRVKFDGGSNMNWDHHDDIYSESHTNIKGGGAGAGRYGIHTWPMMGSLDQALSALIDDLHQRGLLEETLLCIVTEFGRTPKINERKGRDHWTHAFSFAFAGAGVPGGQVVGSTDKDGGYITSSQAYTIDDYAATIYEKLGIDREKPVHTPDGRPIYFAKNGTPIPELF